MSRPYVIIISPALQNANNGNWQTASRWARMLRSRYHVAIQAHWDGKPCDAMIALHARRSAESINAFSTHCPQHALIVALTGTDVYRDIHCDADARRSLDQATQLVVLQPGALSELPASLRAKTRVIFQSAPSLKPLAPHEKLKARCFDAIMIGHMRQEKAPATFMDAASLITEPHIRLLQIGDALDQQLGQLARQTEQACSRYHWLGALAHAQARQRLKRSHVMVIPSIMEGGANAIIEAVTSGVPVLASDISGNRGMLGDDYPGYFPVKDARYLAALIERACREPEYYRQLQAASDAAAARFSPEREREELLRLMAQLFEPSGIRQPLNPN